MTEEIDNLRELRAAIRDLGTEAGTDVDTDDVLELIDRLDQTTSYVATTTAAWGRGFTEDAAIEALLLSDRSDGNHVLVSVHEITGALYEHGPGHVDADAVVDHTEYLVDGGILQDIRGNVKENERLIEDLLIDARDVTDRTAEEIAEMRE